MSIKTYGWLGPERLKFINDNPQVVSLLYDLGLLPEEISARVRGYVEAETERCAKAADDFTSNNWDKKTREVAKMIAREIRARDSWQRRG